MVDTQQPVIPASHRDLIEAPIPVSMATLGPTGYPQVTAIWAVADGDTVVTSLDGIRQKFKNLKNRPQATIFVIDPTNPYDRNTVVLHPARVVTNG